MVQTNERVDERGASSVELDQRVVLFQSPAKASSGRLIIMSTDKPAKQRSRSAEKESSESDSSEGRRLSQKSKQNTEVLLGICAMAKKSQSRPMSEILNRLKGPHIRVVVFQQSMILDEPIKSWPEVDCLIAFYSSGLPFSKVEQYVELRKPFMVNDLRKQHILWDRRLIYQKLKENMIPVVRHFFVMRDHEEDLIKKYKKDSFDDDRDKERDFLFKLISTSSDQLNQVFGKRVEDERRKEEEEINDVLNFIIGSQEKAGDEQHSEQEVLEKDGKAPRRNFTMSEAQLRMRIEKVQRPQRTKLEVQEFDQYLMINGNKLCKPFVEKPFDAEDHRICIYYPTKDGGGRKNLFRKVGNTSSSYQPEVNTIRKDGNYIYEQFLPTNGFDIKVYTVGPYYMHAEARKSPSLDGVVHRTETGKEVRFPVFLTPIEKFISNRIVQVFGQNVCGFDLLRSNGKSYVCDVNGWSFVKDNQKYFEDCAVILKEMILQKFLPHLNLRQNPCKFISNITMNDFRPAETSAHTEEYELRSVVAILRHAERTPKQKMKMKVTEPRLLELFNGKAKEVRIKNSEEMQRLLELTDAIIATGRHQGCESLVKLLQLKSVLQIGGHFEGINRKVQLKAIDVQKGKVLSALMIVKWGGQLTKDGEIESQMLGQIFRRHYPQEKEGLLRLHSTYRHDLKTYSSEEGRCQKTASSFLKGFLALEGDLAPIMASLVNRTPKAQLLLDCSQEQNHNALQLQVKSELSKLMNSKEPLIQPLDQLGSNVRPLLRFMHEQSRRLTSLMQGVFSIVETNYYINPKDIAQQRQLEEKERVGQGFMAYGHESFLLMYKRWKKLVTDFYQERQDIYDVSKIPEIFDTIRYDLNHNRKVFELLGFNPEPFYRTAYEVSSFYVKSEYGLKKSTKMAMALRIAGNLFKKIYIDLIFWRSPSFEEEYWKYQEKKSKNLQDIESRIKSYWRHIRTRLYFTSASHMYSLIFLLILGKNGALIHSCGQEMEKFKRFTHLGYLSSIVLRLFENLSVSKEHPMRFRLNICFSRGKLLQDEVREEVELSSSFNIHDIDTFFQSVLGRISHIQFIVSSPPYSR